MADEPPALVQESGSGVTQVDGDRAPLPRRPGPESAAEPDGGAGSHPDGGAGSHPDGAGRRWRSPDPDVLRNVLVGLRRLD